MTRSAVGPNNENIQVWQLDGNDQWTDPIEFRGLMSKEFSVLVEGAYTGQALVQIRRYHDGSAGSWQTIDPDAFTPDISDGFWGKFTGSFDLRAGFTTLSSGTPIITISR